MWHSAQQGKVWGGWKLGLRRFSSPHEPWDLGQIIVSLWNFGFFIWKREMIIIPNNLKYWLGSERVKQHKRCFVQFALSKVVITVLLSNAYYCLKESLDLRLLKYIWLRKEGSADFFPRFRWQQPMGYVDSYKLRTRVNKNPRKDFLLNLKRLTYVTGKRVSRMRNWFGLLNIFVTSDQKRLQFLWGHINSLFCFSLAKKSGRWGARLTAFVSSVQVRNRL